MPVEPLDPAALAALDAHYGFGLGAEEQAEFLTAVTGTFASSEAVEELYRRTAPEAPVREWETPTENPFGGWYVTSSVTGSGTGPLAGRTVAIKDNVQVAGIPMTNGSRTLEGFVPTRDATVVTRLIEAGATIAGKAVCEDLCFSGGSFTSRPTPVRNPWDETRNAGGSSSGSGALVAGGVVDMAVGGDQGGSIRIPSSFCGAVGHKPTYGLVPYTGAFPIERTLDHLGPITRTVPDAALVLGVLAGVDGLDPRQPTVLPEVDYVSALAQSAAGLRVGILTEGFGHANSEAGVDAAVRQVGEVLRAQGLVVDEVSVPWHLDAMHVWNVIGTEGAAYQMIDGNGYGMNVGGLYDPEIIEYFARQRVERGAELSKTVKLVGLSGRHTYLTGGGKFYAMARNLALDLRAAYDRALADHDVLLLPTLPYTARALPGPDIDLGTYLDLALSMLANTAPFDVTGHPACSVPTELVEGLPAGAMFVGRHLEDATVLRVAHAYEQARGGFPAPAPR